VAWVFGTVETAAGLVARICNEKALPPEWGNLGPSEVYGRTLDGWYVVSLVTWRASRLRLPGLNNFSNPAFCGQWVAYWGSKRGNYSLVVASLREGRVVRSIPVGKLDLATDWEYHLAQATWNDNCDYADFSDDRYIKATRIDVKPVKNAGRTIGASH
jgi:hypothetical protein